MLTRSSRRPLAILALLAMVATLLFAVTGTASAGTNPPASEATFSACPENAGIPDGGFSDVPMGSFFNEAVNCLAYYAVTTGVTPTTYGPGAEVTRAQMALFLGRGAAAAGVLLSSSPPDAGFADIGGLSAAAQLAINQLAHAGIVNGKTPTTYEPASTVTRQQMALFLTRYWDVSTIGPGGSYTAAYSGAPFTDIGSTTIEANQAINAAWDLGIATGTTATTYNPLGTVNRGQMALFLTRMYAHTNTRPVGANIQANPTTGDNIKPHAIGDLDYSVAVTLRTPAFLPMPNAIIDQWNFTYWTTSSLQSPFKTDGTCETGSLQIQQGDGGSLPCVVETSDIAMDAHGNYVDLRGGFVADTYDLYAWIGLLGATFDVDTTPYSMVTVDPTRGADAYELSLDPMSGVVKFGEPVTWVIQVTKGGTALAEAGWTFAIGRQTTNSEGIATTSVSFRTLTTDSNGRATYAASYADPDPGTTNDNWQTENIWVNTANLPPTSSTSATALWTDNSP